jgi:hypothetical protein
MVNQKIKESEGFEMNRKIYGMGVILVVMAVLLTGVAPVTAAEKTEFPCTETFVATLDPGSWAFPDGNIHIRGSVSLFREEAPDPRSVGDNTVVANANWRSDGTGPIWGTWRLETDEGGAWEGTWNGMMTEAGAWYNARGDGSGLYTGMKMWVDMNFGACQVTILEH